MSEIEKRADSEEYARDLDSQIRAIAYQIHVAWEALDALVKEAKTANVHEALGFPSWTAYLADALDGQWKLERDKRGEAIRFLTEQGVSTRAVSGSPGPAKAPSTARFRGAPTWGR